MKSIDKLRTAIFRIYSQHNLRAITLGALFLVFIAAVVIGNTSRNGNKIDWLADSNWSYLHGAEVTDAGILMFPTGRVINHSDTSTAQPNPPVNIRGSHIKTTGDFQIDFAVSGVDNEATAQFYGQVPIIYDEWRQERSSIRFETKDNELKVRIWDGSAANSIDERTYYTELENDAEFSLVNINNEFVIKANGNTLGTIPDHAVFADSRVWFGADAKQGSAGWKLTKLSVLGLNEHTVESIDASSIVEKPKATDSLASLSEANKRKIPIGAAVSIGPLLTDSQYNEIVLGQFSMMTPENSFKPQYMQPLKDLYTFSDTDLFVEAAKNNHMLVHGHSLVMGKANPEWMQRTPEEERRDVMTAHISTIVGRYKNKVAQWDVVNEPMSEDAIDYKNGKPGLRKHMWLDAMGEEYIDIAYKAARAADPQAKLFLNDFGLEKDGERWEAFLSLVTRLQARGVPIDGVGFEAHVYHSPADDIDPAVLKRHIQVLAEMGIESRISEIDVLGDKPKFQAKQYADVLQACLSEPTCTSYGMWGVTDLYGSTTLSDRYPIVLGDSLIWDTDYKKKQAFKSLRAVLSQP